MITVGEEMNFRQFRTPVLEQIRPARLLASLLSTALQASSPLGVTDFTSSCHFAALIFLPFPNQLLS